MQEQIFVTGSTGCIGHYTLVQLRKSFPNAHLHVMARKVERFKIDIENWSNVTLHIGGMDDIGKFKDVLKNIDYLIHIATVWGYDLDVNKRINRDRTLEMFSYLDQNRFKKIVYFSTASILSKNNSISEAAKVAGTPYVKSKLDAYLAIKESKWSNKVITLFPTMVLGGGNQYPYSHISQGLLDIDKHIKWAKWVHLKGSFHFLHSEDIAKMVIIAMKERNLPLDIVMGNQVTTFNKTILGIAEFLNQKPIFQIPFPKWLINIILLIFKSRVDSWGAHCAKNPHFEYNVHSPKDFGENVTFPSIVSALKEMRSLNS